MANFKAFGVLPDDLNWHQKKNFFREEARSILWHCHSSPYGGHYNGEMTVVKVLQSGFYWPTLCKDANEYVRRCDKCQRTCGLSKRNEMPLQSILEIEAFDC